jgi:hypothetical protein
MKNTGALEHLAAPWRSSSKPPADESEQNEQSHYYEIRIHDHSHPARFTPWNACPVGRLRQHQRHVEERRPVRQRNQGRCGRCHGRLKRWSPQKPCADARYSRVQKQKNGRMITCMRMPQRTDNMVCLPIQDEGHGRAADENEGQEQFAKEIPVHDSYRHYETISHIVQHITLPWRYDPRGTRSDRM